MNQLSPPGQNRCHLENLPVEIIQEIFFHCLEFNLPRASLYISRVLSDSTVYTWLIRLAFSSANEGSKSDFFTPDFLPPPLCFFALSEHQRRDLQHEILASRWCTLPLMRKCQREYVEHAIRRKCRNLELAPEDHYTLANINSRFSNLESCDKGWGGCRSKGDLILKARDRDTNIDYKVAVWFHFGAFQVRKPNKLVTDLDLFRLPCCLPELPARMPNKLLGPPWTDTKLEFLQLLSLDAYIDADDTFTRSRRILRQVIRDRDFATFQRLVNMHIRCQCYKYPVRWPVLPNHFQVALKYADEYDDPFIKLLVEQRWEDIPANLLHLKDQLMSKVGTSHI
ncbi:hypothetical protein F9C07_2284856 [Aspergillus flavus]|uniref:Uncharacterized protein n=6 Tax=Aspergillus subgen. Circumdati TaxID=2720871 RepID=A0A7U2QTD8_ASPFN|nr:hypothetical protein AFLA_004666 [Aspergillus flavus NRRL3357]KAJ1716526.1 hypothetical protein NYO67_1332 [Aspergillus flavus]KOC12836.1 hypothetical protein AFLA70_85g003300 [Aspergillus flavus AF70]GMF70116.1 unnamed protein product [Aspergillus oryzae]GMG52378.1 unnamed protein product [Aspergillus oryzae var. brunneus]